MNPGVEVDHTTVGWDTVVDGWGMGPAEVEFFALRELKQVRIERVNLEVQRNLDK